MARKKVKLAWISNDATRRTTLKKRRKGLMKKVKELSILCDVGACAIIYSPNESQPEVWPSAQDATQILTRLRAMPEMERCKKMMNQDAFLRQRVTKLHDQLRRLDRENRELESAALLRECMAGASIEDLRIEEIAALAWVLEHKTKVVQDRIDHLRFAAALQGTISGDAKHVAVECSALTPAPQPQLQLSSQLPMLLPTSVYRDDKMSSYYPEPMRWFSNGGEGSATTAGDPSYQPMAQLGGVGEGSGGVPAGDNVLTVAFVEQNQGNWESFFP